MHTKIKRTLSAGAIMLGVALLTPTTAVYFFGLFIALSGLVSHGAMRFTALGMLLLLLVPGYGLFSSWWLLFRFRELEQIRAIPKPILGGLAAGFGVAILFLWISNSSSPSLLLSPNTIQWHHRGWRAIPCLSNVNGCDSHTRASEASIAIDNFTTNFKQPNMQANLTQKVFHCAPQRGLTREVQHPVIRDGMPSEGI
jgi:hypothetical protein